MWSVVYYTKGKTYDYLHVHLLELVSDVDPDAPYDNV
jgi:hypothetical protein